MKIKILPFVSPLPAEALKKRKPLAVAAIQAAASMNFPRLFLLKFEKRSYIVQIWRYISEHKVYKMGIGVYSKSGEYRVTVDFQVHGTSEVPLIFQPYEQQR